MREPSAFSPTDDRAFDIGDANLRRRAALFGLSLALLTASLGSAAAPAVDAPLADLSLPTLDDSRRTLSERDGPTVLVFFRGVW